MDIRLVIIVAAITAVALFMDVVLTRLALGRMDARKAREESAESPLLFYPVDSDTYRAARISLSKMLNGGFPAAEVSFTPSNTDV